MEKLQRMVVMVKFSTSDLERNEKPYIQNILLTISMNCK